MRRDVIVRVGLSSVVKDHVLVDDRDRLVDECRGCGAYSGVPVLEKASDSVRNSERAATPFFMPRMTGREMYLEAFLLMYR